MPETLQDFLQHRPPTAERPLFGRTILVVEDSRFTCEAMRLLCQRSGARIRRADTLRSAARHLRTYRPSVVIVDLGLPDGCGAELIRTLSQAEPPVDVVLGMSGDDTRQAEAMEAGASGFLAKPVMSLAQFQSAILDHLPSDAHPPGPRLISSEVVHPDPIAFQDDLAHLTAVLSDGPDDAAVDYVARFLAGLAKSVQDTGLEKAAMSLSGPADASARTLAIATVSDVLRSKLTERSAV